MIKIKNVIRTQEKEGVQRLVEKLKNKVRRVNKNKGQTIEDKLHGSKPISED